MSRAHTLPLCRALVAGLLGVLSAGCGDGTGPGRPEITGYSANGLATGTDPATGESLICAFTSWNIPTGGPLTDTWTGPIRLSVIRSRESPSLRVTYDTVIVDQEITLSLLATGEVQLAAAGAFTDTLTAPLDTAYPGFAIGSWTCGPQHPLASMHEGVVLTGEWHLSPEIPFE